MGAETGMYGKKNTRVVLDPPTFSPPSEMRKSYLNRRLAELDMLLDSARAGDWKPVASMGNHVRGTGAMYGFKNVGDAAEDLTRAIQNGASDCLDYLEKYATAVRESYV